MLPKQILTRPFALHNKNFGKYATKKPQTHHQDPEDDDKQNQQNSTNIFHPTVDLTKKIRKRSPKKHRISHEKPIQTFNGHPVFKESELDMDPQLLCMIQPQRIDNDVDTDQEQIQSGIDKLRNFLKEACLQRMYSDDYE